MTNFNPSVRKAGLLASTATAAAFLSLIAAPAFAQDAPAATPPAPVADQAAPASEADIVVTGTLFRNASAATASPVTVLTSTDLANRGITTVADAVQSLSANNGGKLPPAAIDAVVESCLRMCILRHTPVNPIRKITPSQIDTGATLKIICHSESRRTEKTLR